MLASIVMDALDRFLKTQHLTHSTFQCEIQPPQHCYLARNLSTTIASLMLNKHLVIATRLATFRHGSFQRARIRARGFRKHPEFLSFLINLFRGYHHADRNTNRSVIHEGRTRRRSESSVRPCRLPPLGPLGQNLQGFKVNSVHYLSFPLTHPIKSIQSCSNHRRSQIQANTSHFSRQARCS